MDDKKKVSGKTIAILCMALGLLGVAASAAAFGYSGNLAVGIGSGLPGLVCFFIGLLLLASQKKS